VATLALTAPASAEILPGNQLLNPGAETDAGVTDEIATPCPSGWNCAGTGDGPTAVRYGTTTFPGLDESAWIGGGRNFFAGGRTASTGLNTSLEHVIQAAGEEWSGGRDVRVTISGCFGGWQNNADFAVASLVAESIVEGRLLTITTAPVTAADRENQTKLLPRSVSAELPRGADRLEAVVDFAGGDGTYNDGYADNLSVTMGNGPEDPPAVDCTPEAGGGDPGGGDPGGGGDPDGNDPEPPADVDRTLGFARKATVRMKRGQVRTKLTCNTDRVEACEGTLTAALVKGAGRSARAAKPLAVGSYSVPSLGTAKAKLDLTTKGAKKIAKLSDAKLAKRALELRATTELGAQDASDSATLAIKRKD